jgi:hypothetical protein
MFDQNLGVAITDWPYSGRISGHPAAIGWLQAHPSRILILAFLELSLVRRPVFNKHYFYNRLSIQTARHPIKDRRAVKAKKL